MATCAVKVRKNLEDEKDKKNEKDTLVNPSGAKDTVKATYAQVTNNKGSREGRIMGNHANSRPLPPPPPKMVHTRTIILQRRKTNEGQLKDCLETIEKKIENADSKITFVRRLENGSIAIACKNEESKSLVEEEWTRMVERGETQFAPVKDENNVMVVDLELINLEYPLEYVEAGLHRYLKKTKIHVSYYFGKVMTPFIRIYHEGIRKPFGDKLFYAPGIFGWVKRVSHRSYASAQIWCTNCRMQGHLMWNCSTPRTCFKCRKPGHDVAECPLVKVRRSTEGVEEKTEASPSGGAQEEAQEDAQEEGEDSEQGSPQSQSPSPPHPPPPSNSTLPPATPGREGQKRKNRESTPVSPASPTTSDSSGSWRDQSPIPDGEMGEMGDESGWSELKKNKKKKREARKKTGDTSSTRKLKKYKEN